MCSSWKFSSINLLLEGFQTGLFVQLKNVSLSRDADLIVAQPGVTNFVAARSLSPQISREIKLKYGHIS